jgi:AraC-like DNA-binding protein
MRFPKRWIFLPRFHPLMTDPFTLLQLSNQVSSPRYFHLESKLSAEEIFVICGGMERCDADYLMDRKDFPYYGLEFVAEGTGELLLDGHSHPLHPGVAFVYGPGIPHRISNSSTRPMTKYFIIFSGSDAGRLLDDCGLAPGRAVQSLKLRQILLLVDQLIADGAERNENSTELCTLYLRAILLKLGGEILLAPSEVEGGMSQFHQWSEFIDLNFKELRDLKDIAAGLHVRQSQLCRVFQRNGQSGPFRYLTRRKMNHAAELLATSSRQVKEVADEIGYPDPYHFSRLFKKHFGYSPREFAKIYRRITT